jgi:hypothetical protein
MYTRTHTRTLIRTHTYTHTGEYHYRAGKDAELHLNDPEAMATLQVWPRVVCAVVAQLTRTHTHTDTHTHKCESNFYYPEPLMHNPPPSQHTHIHT